MLKDTAIAGGAESSSTVFNKLNRDNVYSLEEAKLLKNNPDLLATAEEIGLSQKATIQFIKQSLQAAANKAAAEMSNFSDSSSHSSIAIPQQHQRQRTESLSYIEQARIADGGVPFNL